MTAPEQLDSGQNCQVRCLVCGRWGNLHPWFDDAPTGMSQGHFKEHHHIRFGGAALEIRYVGGVRKRLASLATCSGKGARR